MGKEERECPKEVVWSYRMKLFGRKKDQSQNLSKDCQVLKKKTFSGDFKECNIRVDSEFCLTRAEKGLRNKFNSQLKYRFRGMNRKIERPRRGGNGEVGCDGQCHIMMRALATGQEGLHLIIANLALFGL